MLINLNDHSVDRNYKQRKCDVFHSETAKEIRNVRYFPHVLFSFFQWTICKINQILICLKKNQSITRAEKPEHGEMSEITKGSKFSGKMLYTCTKI